MNYNVAICDDEQKSRDAVTALANEWARSRGHVINLTHYTSAESFLFSYRENREVDILLLDIEMGEMNGVELAKTLRRDNKILQIVFVTGYSDYISEGYEVAALHYLLKPLRPEKFLKVLDRAAERIKIDGRSLTLECSDETVRVPLYEIKYLEVVKNYVTVHANGDYTVKKALAEFERELDERFLRVGRSFIVNLMMIHKVTKTDIYLRSGEIIPLSRGAYETVNRAIINMK